MKRRVITSYNDFFKLSEEERAEICSSYVEKAKLDIQEEDSNPVVEKVVKVTMLDKIKKFFKRK
jgi:hypothetical protein